MNQYTLTVGLEVHVELKTQTKMFCGCKNEPFNSSPNTNVCPVCYGLPGALPLLNQTAIRKTVELGQALNGQIASKTFWARKNYFYPDLPKGYQISQSTAPLVEKATLIIDGTPHHIDRIHLEEDAGKSVHQANQNGSLVNYNRAGVPLMEIVTEPDFHSAAAAKSFCQELQRVMRALDISDADMEKGQMRCEANISISSTDQLGTKVEVKNINSFRAVEKAIEYEEQRQVKLLEEGEKVRPETRSWNAQTNQTVTMRTKETSADYRYFPEPDLPVVAVELSQIAAKKLPEDRRQALATQGVPAAIAQALVDKNLDERVLVINSRVSELAKEAAHLMLEWPDFAGLPVQDQIKLLEAKQQNGWTKEVLATVVTQIGDGQQLEEIISKYASDLNLEPIILAVLAANKPAVTDYQAGKEAALNFLVGQVMAGAKGKANIATVRTELEQALRK